MPGSILSARRTARPDPSVGVSPDPGAFSISTDGTAVSMPRTTSSSCGQITMTTRDRLTTKRSSQPNVALTSRDLL